MKERPIIFSGPMVRAILEGRKTQTRRVVDMRGLYFLAGAGCDKDDPHYWGQETPDGDWIILARDAKPTDCEYPLSCPYGQPGDRLWVRETWFHNDDGEFFYRASHPLEFAGVPGARWNSSIHMPRWASRITLEVLDVRVERVQDISEEDALAEGVRAVTKDGQLFKHCVYDRCDYSSTPWQDMPRTAIGAFKTLWDTLNAKRGHGWDANPWVWVVKFRKLPQ